VPTTGAVRRAEVEAARVDLVERGFPLVTINVPQYDPRYLSTQNDGCSSEEEYEVPNDFMASVRSAVNSRTGTITGTISGR
jgi:hypothetical protein